MSLASPRPTVIDLKHVTCVGVPGADVGEEYAPHADRRGSDDEQQPQQQKAEPDGGGAGGRGSSGGRSGARQRRWQQRHPADAGASHLFIHGECEKRGFGFVLIGGVMTCTLNRSSSMLFFARLTALAGDR